MDHIAIMTDLSTGLSARPRLPLALTMGEPAGIGPELSLDAWLRLRESGTSFVLFADPDLMAAVARNLGRNIPVAVVGTVAEGASRFRTALPIIPVNLINPVQPGRPDPANAAAVIRSIELAVDAAKRGEAGAVVTNPIQKAALYSAGFRHPGHTEFLGEIAGTGIVPVMMLASPDLRVVPVTIHMSLRGALEALHPDAIVETTQTVVRALRWDFGIETPRVAIAGVNPHAGENGAMGDEDIRIVAPAVERLRKAGISVAGPMSPDTMFTARARQNYDAAICMYHDQALIPIKTLDVDGGVNVTLGLSIVRTSPDHGTALDIAGKGIADVGSLVAAIRMADMIVSNRSKERKDAQARR
jgi:4-hydroxythreonine-4-phosphate dehydrogenase